MVWIWLETSLPRRSNTLTPNESLDYPAAKYILLHNLVDK